jgi:AcrR family transcriptional regulator
MINGMARRPHAEASSKVRRLAPVVAAASTSRRSSQRQRLLGAITDLAIRDGFTAVTVGQVIARAGVSRATFYEYFIDLEACFAAALAPIRRRLLAGIRSSVASDRVEHATLRATHALFTFASSRPAKARLLMNDSLTGGSRLRSVRDELIDAAAAIVEDAHARAGSGASIPDLPPRLLIGTSCRLIASQLYEDESRLQGLHEQFLGWMAAFEAPVARHRWQTLAALPPAPRSPFLAPGALCAPSALIGSRARKVGALAENHWSRIVFATAEVVRRDGYSAATVARITEAAGVDARAFYRLFACKRQALAGGCELLFRHAMAAAAGAFVAGEDWPERLWEAARALTQYADGNPTLTYVALVESHTGSASAMRRAEGLTHAFTIFLQDGFAHLHGDSRGAVAQPSELALEAISAAVFELAYRHAREDAQVPLSTLLAPIVFLSLAPFLGADAASDFVCRATPHAQRQLANAA